MAKTEIIAIDTGNRFIKTEHFTFTGGLVHHGTTPPAVSTVDTVKYKGQYYSLTTARDAYRRDKTIDEVYLVLSMAAMAKELLYGGAQPGELVERHVALSMGLPIAHLQRLREKYAKYFFGDENHRLEFEYNGTPFRITVDAVHVWPQGYSAAIADKCYTEFAAYPRAYIVDIGGYTTDVSVLANGKADMSYCESIEMGVIHLINKVKAAVQEECNYEIDDIAAESLLHHDPKVRVSPVLMKTVDNARKEYTSTLLRTLREKGIDFVTSYMIFMGGGSLMMEKDIKEYVGHDMIHFIDSVNANAAGYAALSRRLLRSMSVGAEDEE